MKAVIQRVTSARVMVEGKEVSAIQKGLLTLFGVEKGDKEEAIAPLIEKIVNLRIFEDSNGKMNLSLKDVEGEHMIVSQFTLLGDCSKGRRPHFMNAEKPDIANEFYKKAVQVSEKLVPTKQGVFAGDMKIDLTNDGPVTFIL